MSKVTSKLQVTIPKAIAERYGIAPGDEIEWVPAGPSVLVVPPGAARAEEIPVEERLAIFDETHRRLRALRREADAREDRTRSRRDLASDPDTDPEAGPKVGSGGPESPETLAEGSPRDRRRRHEAARGWAREELYERGGRKLGDRKE